MKVISLIAMESAAVLCAGCGVIGECLTDAQCDDGVFCNGAEVCTSTCQLGLPGAGGCVVEGPNVCQPAGGNFAHPCCTQGFGRQLTSACDSACNEADQTCDMGNECTTNVDCDDGIDCTGEDFCENGFCYNHGRNGFDWIYGGTNDLSQCREACRARGFGRVTHFYGRVCNCGVEQHCRWEDFDVHSIEDRDNRGCDVVCLQAGWPTTQGRDPNAPNMCYCATRDSPPDESLESCMEWCIDNGDISVRGFSPVGGPCYCTDGTDVFSDFIFDEHDLGCDVICGQLGWLGVSGVYEHPSYEGKEFCQCLGPIAPGGPQPTG